MKYDIESVILLIFGIVLTVIMLGLCAIVGNLLLGDVGALLFTILGMGPVIVLVLRILEKIGPDS